MSVKVQEILLFLRRRGIALGTLSIYFLPNYGEVKRKGVISGSL